MCRETHIICDRAALMGDHDDQVVGGLAPVVPAGAAIARWPGKYGRGRPRLLDDQDHLGARDVLVVDERTLLRRPATTPPAGVWRTGGGEQPDLEPKWPTDRLNPTATRHALRGHA